MSTRYFHGTLADLPVGTVLLPGGQIGTSYYSRSEHVYMTSTSFTPEMGNTVDLAIHYAARWAALAADTTCTNERHGYDPVECECDAETDDDCVCPHSVNGFHGDSVNENLWPSCMFVYEVEPLGAVEPDLAHDVDPGSVRTSSARILQRVRQPRRAQK